MRQSAILAVALTAATLPAIGFAAHRQPGQWVQTSQVRFTQGGPQIPPELRARMEARGVKLPGMGGPHTFTTCLAPEEAAKEEHPDFGKDNRCTMQNAGWSGNHFHGELNCSMQSGSISHGVIDGTLGDGGRQYSGTSRVEGDNPAFGGHFVMDGQYSGKWLGPTCSKDAS